MRGKAASLNCQSEAKKTFGHTKGKSNLTSTLLLEEEDRPDLKKYLLYLEQGSFHVYRGLLASPLQVDCVYSKHPVTGIEGQCLAIFTISQDKIELKIDNVLHCFTLCQPELKYLKITSNEDFVVIAAENKMKRKFMVISDSEIYVPKFYEVRPFEKLKETKNVMEKIINSKKEGSISPISWIAQEGSQGCILKKSQKNILKEISEKKENVKPVKKAKVSQSLKLPSKQSSIQNDSLKTKTVRPKNNESLKLTSTNSIIQPVIKIDKTIRPKTNTIKEDKVVESGKPKQVAKQADPLKTPRSKNDVKLGSKQSIFETDLNKIKVLKPEQPSKKVTIGSKQQILLKKEQPAKRKRSTLNVGKPLKNEAVEEKRPVRSTSIMEKLGKRLQATATPSIK